MQDVLRQLKMKIDDYLYARCEAGSHAVRKRTLNSAAISSYSMLFICSVRRIQMMQQGPPQVVSSQGPLYQGAPGSQPAPQMPTYQQHVYQQPQQQPQQPPQQHPYSRGAFFICCLFLFVLGCFDFDFFLPIDELYIELILFVCVFCRVWRWLPLNRTRPACCHAYTRPFTQSLRNA